MSGARHWYGLMREIDAFERRRRRKVRAFVAICLIVAVAVLWSALAFATPPLSASVRVRVPDRAGVDFGSGTIISREGRTFVLTCGHIFRGHSHGDQVSIDVFEGDQVRTLQGHVAVFDLQADVGLAELRTDRALPAATLAQQTSRPKRGDQVQSIGCPHGERPSAKAVQVTAINRYDGPENIECTGVPRQGRSGGGLFNDKGEVVGVCIAADPEDGRGLYAGPGPIRALLQKVER